MPSRVPAKGLRQFLGDEQQRAWLGGHATPVDVPERHDSFEHRFRYAGRLEKLLRRPQAADAIAVLRAYAATCLPIPRTTERFYWSVSCLPSTDKSLARVNASWMELFALLPESASPLVGEDQGGGPAASAAERILFDRPPPNPPHKGEGLTSAAGLQARFILHLSDFTPDGSIEPGHLDEDRILQCVDRPENVTHFFWKGDTLGVKVRTAASIRAFMAHPHASRAIRRFNLTHMNRGRNAYQASHCYSLADRMLD